MARRERGLREASRVESGLRVFYFYFGLRQIIKIVFKIFNVHARLGSGSGSKFIKPKLRLKLGSFR